MNATTYEGARQVFADWGVDTEAAIAALGKIPISLNAWQGDDVMGFEARKGGSTGGTQVTGNMPGRANTPDELRADLDFALAQIPGTHRVNLQAFHVDTDEAPDRDELEYRHFSRWVDWAKAAGIGLDFNATCFSHPKVDDMLTLAHPDAAVRQFWIEHCRRSRVIAAEIGRALGQVTVNNIWVPDGSKDIPVDRMAARRRLEASLDEVFAEPHDRAHLRDAVEPKLFGIGVEAMTVGSAEFYLGYAVRKGILLCIDTGHFHPTEIVADKVSAVLLSLDEIMLHVSRPMRWDSDHVILLNDDILMLAQELVFAGVLERTRIGLDFFDATISRPAAWIIGTRAMQKALLRALLLPQERLKAAEERLDFTTRLVLTEELKDLPFGAVWQELCARDEAPVGAAVLAEIDAYQAKVSNRGTPE